MKTRRCISILLGIICVTTSAAAQFEDVVIVLRSGETIEGEVTASAKGMLSMQYDRYYGPSKEDYQVVTMDFHFDTLSTVTIGSASSAGSTFLLITLLGTGIGTAVAASDRGPYAGLGLIFFGGLGAIVGGVAAIIQSSTSDDDRVFSPGIAHDARLLEERLRRSEEDPQWGQSFALRTVRECVPELRVLLKNGREYNGWLIASGEGAIVFLVSEESLEENGESEELRSTPFAEIVAIEGQVFATEDDPFNGEWRPEENPKSLLQSYVFSNISVAASEAAESTP